MKDRSIQQHINDDKDLLDNSTLSPQMRRHVEDELTHLERYQANHSDEDYDPTPLEMYCDENPAAVECKIYED
jgi:ribosome-associated translation inhibitor RaiA